MTIFLFILESFSFVLALLHNHLLAHKKKHAWSIYVLFSFFTVTLFALKSSYITVINQTYLGVTAIYLWIWWHHRDNKIQTVLNRGSWVFFMGSLWFFRYNNVGDWFEIASWYCIYMKNNLTRTENATGWIYMIWQKILTVIFNILRANYILAFRNLLQLWQAVYGYKKWKEPTNIPLP